VKQQELSELNVTVTDSLHHNCVGCCPLSEVYLIYMTLWELALILSSGEWLPLGLQKICQY